MDYMTDLFLLWLLSLNLQIIGFFVFELRWKRLKWSEKLQELEVWKQMGMIHYKEMENQRSQFSKLRHDLNNHLMTAYYLMERGEEVQVRDILSELELEMERTIEKIYCKNPIVDTIMKEKAIICSENGIILKTNLLFDELPGIQVVHLCTIFLSLMDQVISILKSSSEHNRYISIKAAVSGDYLHVKMENPASEDQIRQIEKSSEFSKKFKAIAMHYNGEFNSIFEGGIYKVRLSLTLSEQR